MKPRAIDATSPRVSSARIAAATQRRSNAVSSASTAKLGQHSPVVRLGALLIALAAAALLGLGAMKLVAAGGGGGDSPPPEDVPQGPSRPLRSAPR